MIRFTGALAGLITFALHTPPALALETEGYGYVDEHAWVTVPTPVDPSAPGADEGRRLHKFEYALKLLGIPLEKAPDFTQYPDANVATQEAFSQTMRFVDPEGGLRRYLDQKPGSLDLFRDYFSHLLPPDFLEYTVDVRPSGESNDSEDLMNRLVQISGQAQDPQSTLPLAGVRIVIDPGHMGNELWEGVDGKYVEIHDKKNNIDGRVSEGQLTLWTAFLVADKLEALGANVKLTRYDLAPVSKKDYRTFDYTQYLNQYFYDSFDDWMNSYLALGDQELAKKIRTFDRVKKVFPDPNNPAAVQKVRNSFFIKGEDLESRSRFISTAFDKDPPDITLDIHYDAAKTNAYQTDKSINRVTGYVPGGFSAKETGSRNIRALAFRQALEARRWNESVELTSAIASGISQQTGIPLLEDATQELNANQPIAWKVKNGVYARNLYITRRSLKGLVAYMECLHYDYLPEFKSLLKRDKSAVYQGLTFRYPGRIEQVANGIRDGILSYFKNVTAQPGKSPLGPEQRESL